MLIDVKRIDVAPVLVARQQPTLMLKRVMLADDGLRRIKPTAATLNNSEEWWILQHKLPCPDDQPKWSVDKTSESVRIPLFEYLIPDPSIDVLVQFGGQTAAIATALIPKDREVSRLLLVFGNAFQRPDGKPGYQAWAGFAICFD